MTRKFLGKGNEKSCPHNCFLNHFEEEEEEEVKVKKGYVHLNIKPDIKEMFLDQFIKNENDKKYVCGAMRRYRSLTPFRINHVKIDYKTNYKIRSRNYFSLFAR